MHTPLDRVTWIKLLAIFLLVLLLGITPRPHRYTELLNQAQRVQLPGAALDKARLLAQAAELIPYHTALWQEAGMLALQGKDPALAIEYLEKATTARFSSGLTTEGQLALAEAYRQTGDLPAALHAWDTAIQQGAFEIPTRTDMLQMQLHCQDQSGALDTLAHLAALQPGNADWQYQLALLESLNDPHQAQQYFQHAAEMDTAYAGAASTMQAAWRAASGNDDPAYQMLVTGRGLASLDRWDLATQAFQQAVDMRADYAEAWAFLGEALQHTQPTDLDNHLPACTPINVPSLNSPQQSTDSLAALEKALRLDPASLSANMFLALYWQRQNNYPLALEQLDKALQLYPKNSTLLTERGKTLATLGDLEAAASSYQQAVSSEPYNIAFLKLLIQFSVQYRYELETIALPNARQGMKTYPDDPEFYNLMGRSLYLLDDFTSAKVFLQRATQLQPGYASAHLHLGEVYYQLGDLNAARQALLAAQQLGTNTQVGEQAYQLLNQLFP